MGKINSITDCPGFPEIPGVEIRHCPGFVGYAVGTNGEVWSCMHNGPGSRARRKWKLLSGSIHNNYRCICLRRSGHSFDRKRAILVLEAFVGPCPSGMEICHNNGDAKNDLLSNLRWDTHRNNIQDAVKQGHTGRVKGEKHGQARLTERDVLYIREYQGLRSQSFLARQFKVSQPTINDIQQFRTWKHLSALKTT